MSIDIEKNRIYYSQLSLKELCQCAYCLNYTKQIRDKYHMLAQYLDELGIDIEKPFETMPLEPDKKGMLEYIEAQYIAFGTPDEFVADRIDGARLYPTESHPYTGISQPHFVLAIGPVFLKALWLSK